MAADEVVTNPADENRSRRTDYGSFESDSLGFKGRSSGTHGDDDHDHAHGPDSVEVRGEATGTRGDVPMRFVSLHHHSTYSYLDGIGLPSAHVRRASELNMTALAITEHGNVSSHVKLEEAAEKVGVAPIFGCELYTGPTDEANRSQTKKHLTVLSETPEGYGNLLRLVSRSFEEGFYYNPTVDMNMLRSQGQGLVILSGCLGGDLHCSLVGGKDVPDEDASYERGLEVARGFRDTFGDAYYLEVQAFPELEKTCEANPLIAKIGRELGIPLVATLDCHYTMPEESELQMVLHNIRGAGKQTLEEQLRTWGYKAQLCPPASDAAIRRALRATGLSPSEAMRAVHATEEIAARCKGWTLPKLPALRYRDPAGKPAQVVWEELLRDGWNFRNLSGLPDRQRLAYKKRLAYERKTIEDKDFIDYFLVVGDIVRWAKDNGIPVGPARGSAAGSLICWLLRITEVNPMLYEHLVFERFIDVSRMDLPDIDLDFDSDRRHEVRGYMVERYGDECVNNVGTFTTYKSRIALDDIARVYRIPKFEVETIKAVLIERSSGDLRSSATLEDTIEEFDVAREVVDRYPELRLSAALEGNVKGFGVHAAGFVVSNGPVTDVCAIYQRKVHERILNVVSLDKFDAERQGLLKIDLLGLSTMAMIAEALRHLDLPIQSLYDLPLDDEKVIDGFRDNDVVGVFQYDGAAMTLIAGQIRPDSFDEVCVVTALARPGPLHNGATEEYIAIKHAGRKPELIHPALTRITERTNNQIVYQEQILRIVRDIGGFDWTAAGYIRKIISKKLGEQEFNRQWSRFREGAARLHPDMTEEQAKRIWGSCITAGSYAFNAAHSVSYGMLAYWTMWLKVYHPTVFYASALAKLPDTRQYKLLRDATKHGVAVFPPDPGLSQGSWLPNESLGALQAGLSQLPGCGAKMAEAILLDREENGEIESWAGLVRVRGIGTKKVQAWAEFSEADDPFEIRKLDRALESAREVIRTSGLPRPTHGTLDIPFASDGRDVSVCWMGIPRERNLRDIFEINRARSGEELDPTTVRDPHLNEFVLILGDDGEELVRLRFDRWKYPVFRKAIWEIKLDHDVLLIQGYKPGWRAAREVYVTKMWVIDPT